LYRLVGVVGAGGKEAAIIRGPIVSRVINQLIASTDWGELDYLIVDMPPGTGDIQITLSQSIAFSGAVIVSTPHILSVADAIKGVKMFADLNVPTLALVILLDP
jgi:ATP-binding protein involved in chromosome partitioning